MAIKALMAVVAIFMAVVVFGLIDLMSQKRVASPICQQKGFDYAENSYPFGPMYCKKTIYGSPFDAKALSARSEE